MSDAGEKKIPEGIRNELEHSEVPLAVYRFVDGHIQTILVSDGLVRWQAPGSTREDLLKFLDTDMYRDVHREDIVFVATKAKEFAKSKDGRYEVVYRQKLYGKDEYRTLHAQGYHRVLDDGSECAIVVYDDVTSAFDTCKNFRNEFDNSLIEFLNNDSVEPFVIVDAKTHEIYMLSASVDKVWTPVKAFDSGITFEEYFFDPNEVQLITLEEVLEKGEVLVPNSRTGGDLILKASLIKWHGKDAIFHRISERTDRYFDTLTGLPNMEYCRMRGESYVTDIRIAGGTPSVAFFDIVGMKLYNNANGYDKGNEFLLNFAAALKKVFPNNLICRLANDHFTVVADMKNIEDKLCEVRKYVKSVVSKISMDVNIGISKIDEFETMVDANEKAKIACKVQKSSSDSFVRYYDEDLRKALVLQNYVVNHIDEAIKNGYIKVYYQPVVRTITETFCGMEALARWVDPQYGFLNPAVFIGALEESRQIHKLDSHVINIVCKEMRAELDAGKPIVPVSFNLSRLDFIGCDIFDVVERALEKYSIDREYIRVEITESIMASDSYVRSEIQRFRLVGYEVWMDDFGSGYSSLNTLKDYKFDELKIDMAFLSNFNDASRTIISSTVRMAKNLGLKTLAEGVETKEQMDFLKGIGCEKVQGYYYGKPQPLKDTMKHMESIGMAVEDHNARVVYSKLGSLDYLVDSPKGILSYKDGLFKFLFVNKQFEEQISSLGFAHIEDVEKAINDPKDPAYYTLHEAEKAAYTGPREITYAARGSYVFLSGCLIADIEGNHIYDMSLRNTHVSAFDISSSSSKITSLPTDAKTILLADMNPQNRAFLESVLRSNYNLLLAEDGEQVLNFLLEYGNHISLALIAADLPKIDGFKIIQKFRGEKRECQIPFIVMTDNMELAKEGMRLGAYQFIHTPITSRDQVKSKIDGAIKNTEVLHQLALNYMEYVPGGVILLEAVSGDILYVNGRALEIFDCDNVDDFRSLAGNKFEGAVLPEDYAAVDETLETLFRSRSALPSQTTYRVRTKKGFVKRIYHVGRYFRDTPYGRILSVFVSEDDMALKNYFGRKNAFKLFMASGEATHTKSYEPGYKGYLFWNLTRNSPVIRMDGISYIPKELTGKYTYDAHFDYLVELMSKDSVNIQKTSSYTREKLILAYANKRAVPSLNLNYNLKNGWFSIKSTFDMMADPDTGDVILKLQNENDTDVEAYKELTDAVVMNLYDQIIYLDGNTDRLLSLSCLEGKPMYVQRTISDSMDNLCKLFQMPVCTAEKFMEIAKMRSASGETYGRTLTLDDGHVKFVRAKPLYNGSDKYIITVSDITHAKKEFQ
ncbi:response regulator [Fibrobacter succinogenes subsp. succinogenes S85]|uniref:Response regulator n=1 Tax=Fibrobacter succinogenes (strain ATCC 19169 / S85) TaxID=59374 RepID=C9RKL7_FIBSS|nr:EAL domain-containing protein [Fibrobacter succinogenes]ACX73945.1 response regulator receiver modulated diguanylate cyclase/phosphodiesterase [Fibrobacter succinogenes subsp. succinogenes S85]ADL24975.1 response regulator [Fibrobacter succinogenes subsp. succinogenes S85]